MPKHVFISYKHEDGDFAQVLIYKIREAGFETWVDNDRLNAVAYKNKGNALSDLKRYEDALSAYDQAIRLDPNRARAYNNKGLALEIDV